MPTTPRHRSLRLFLAAASLALVVVTVTFTIYKFTTTSLVSGLADIKFNELTNESIKNRIDFSRSLFQIGLLILGALWGLVIAKKDEAGILFADRPEWIMFLSASILLLASLVDHSLYLHDVSGILAIAGETYDGVEKSMPDVFDPNINNFYMFQIAHLALGFLVAMLTLLSAHKLKENP